MGAVKGSFRLSPTACAAKMRCAFPSAMTSAAAPPPSAAVAAFLRGLDRRAQLFATVQAGDPARGARALAAVARVFAAEAAQWPLAQWPQQYWRLLLATPSLRHAVGPGTPPVMPGVARLPPEQRAGVLLHLVAGLEDEAAASALGLEVPAYQALLRDSLPRNQLNQPDLDVWRAWRAAAQRELERAPDPPPLSKTTVAPAAADRRAAPPAAEPATAHGVRWLWLGVGGCVLAFAAAFFIHPAGREAIHQWFAAIRREALPPAAAPKARFAAGDIALHPDRELLASPQEAWFAERLALLAWLAKASDPARPDAVPLPILDQTSRPPLMDAGTEAMSLPRRMQRWDALPARLRGLQRGHWQAWRALEPAERVQLRAIGLRVRPLAAQEWQALHERFAAQSSDARAGWWLGPRLGQDWPRVAALFGYVEEAERERLLRFLRDATEEDIDACARLAQSTPPEQRAALRADLLAQPGAQRGAWLQARLQR